MAFKQSKWSGWQSPYRKGWAFKGKIHREGQHGDLIQADRNKSKVYIEDVPVSLQNWLQRHINDPTKQKSLLTRIFKGKRKGDVYKPGLGDRRIFGGAGVRNIKRSQINT